MDFHNFDDLFLYVLRCLLVRVSTIDLTDDKEISGQIDWINWKRLDKKIRKLWENLQF